MMVVAMSLLYSRISPSLIGYEAETNSNNQEFIFLNIETQVARLATLPPGSVATVDILSRGAVYDVIDGKNVTIGIAGRNSTLFATPFGMFKASLDKRYQGVSTSHFLGDGIEENTMFINDSVENFAFGISKVEIEIGNATYWQYFRGKLDLVQTAGSYTLNIFVYRILADPTDFPLLESQWVLRLRRGEPTITTQVVQADVNGLRINQTATHTVDPLDSYSYTDIPDGTFVTVNFIEIPIYYET